MGSTLVLGLEVLSSNYGFLLSTNYMIFGKLFDSISISYSTDIL